MSKLIESGLELRELERLANKKTLIHQVNATAKLVVTLILIGITVSFSKYALIEIIPLLIYPVIIMNLADLSTKHFFKKILVGLPFVLLIAFFNLWYDQTAWLIFGKVSITGGMVSFLVILLKFILTVSAGLLLIATTPLTELTTALLRLKIPPFLITQLSLTYRYLSVLLEETATLLQAYSLRSFKKTGVQYQVWGSLVGQLLLRTLARAERVHQAMLCRGFQGIAFTRNKSQLQLCDWYYLCAWVCFFVLVRLLNLPEILGMIFTGGFR